MHIHDFQGTSQAIRPAGHPFELPESLRNTLNTDEFKLFDLIWKRTIASQMADAELEKTTAKIGISTVQKTQFVAQGEVLKFDGFLKVAPACEACGYDFSKADSGDGPAVFVILIAGFVVAFAAVFTEFTVHPPIWVHLIVWLPATLVLSLGLMRPLKGVMLAAQFMNKAAEARHDD